MQDFVLFVSPASCKRSGFAAGCTVLPKNALLPSVSSGKRSSLAALPARHQGGEVKPHSMAGKECAISNKRWSQPRCCGSCLQWRQGEGKSGSSSLRWELLRAVKWEARGW